MDVTKVTKILRKELEKCFKRIYDNSKFYNKLGKRKKLKR